MLAHILFAFPGFLCVRGGLTPVPIARKKKWMDMMGWAFWSLWAAIGNLWQVE